MTHGVGTACLLAPEVIKHARSSKYSDVYGYGIVLWELATREEVYQGLETTQIIAKVANESLRPPIPQDCPCKDVMVKCWEENPHDRLEFSEIVQELGFVSKGLAELQEREYQRQEEETSKPEAIDDKTDDRK
jgi:serine/threonine protein kinase